MGNSHRGGVHDGASNQTQDLELPQLESQVRIVGQYAQDVGRYAQDGQEDCQQPASIGSDDQARSFA